MIFRASASRSSSVADGPRMRLALAIVPPYRCSEKFHTKKRKNGLVPRANQGCRRACQKKKLSQKSADALFSHPRSARNARVRTPGVRGITGAGSSLRMGAWARCDDETNSGAMELAALFTWIIRVMVYLDR